MKKLTIFLVILTLGITFVLGFSTNTFATNLDFPEKSLQGTIMWSAGGITDNVSRAIGQYAEEYLEKKIVYTNRPGAAGGIATNYVYQQPSNGYNLLFGAENPQIAKVMGTSELDYDNFIPITLYSTSVGVALVNSDSDYESFKELIQDIQENPGELAMGTTGPGGLPFTVNAMMKNVHDIDVKKISYGGEAEAVNAVLGGHVDFTITTLGSSVQLLESGKLKGLTVFTDQSVNTEQLDVLKNIPLVVDIYSEYEKYMPWGAFYGVYVKEGTPKEIVDKLTTAFSKAADNSELKERLIKLGTLPMNITGKEAREYVDNYKSITSWLLYETGQTEYSPEKFNIEKPE